MKHRGRPQQLKMQHKSKAQERRKQSRELKYHDNIKNTKIKGGVNRHVEVQRGDKEAVGYYLLQPIMLLGKPTKWLDKLQ